LSSAKKSTLSCLRIRDQADRVAQIDPRTLAQLTGERLLAFLDGDCIITTLKNSSRGFDPGPKNLLAVDISVRHGISSSTS
jgi:hypothetical protein